MTPRVLLGQSVCVCVCVCVCVLSLFQVVFVVSLSKKDLYIHAASLCNRDLVAWGEEAHLVIITSVGTWCLLQKQILAGLELLWNFGLCILSL